MLSKRILSNFSIISNVKHPAPCFLMIQKLTVPLLETGYNKLWQLEFVDVSFDP